MHDALDIKLLGPSEKASGDGVVDVSASTSNEVNASQDSAYLFDGNSLLNSVETDTTDVSGTLADGSQSFIATELNAVDASSAASAMFTASVDIQDQILVGDHIAIK